MQQNVNTKKLKLRKSNSKKQKVGSSQSLRERVRRVTKEFDDNTPGLVTFSKESWEYANDHEDFVWE